MMSWHHGYLEQCPRGGFHKASLGPRKASIALRRALGGFHSAAPCDKLPIWCPVMSDLCLPVQRSVMEIDDRWQSAYGDLDFDSAKFPDAPGMVRQLHAMGFKVTVWVMPFVEENSAAYR